MKIDILTTAAALSDQDLLARLSGLAGREREATVELVAHLCALEARPSVYAAQGYGSLFGYCTHALRLSEDATCSRIEAARACRRFPVILDLMAAGAVTLTAVRLLAPHLTPENHQAVLERARGRSRREIESLVVELAPRPDVPTSVRRLPTPTPSSSPRPPAAPVRSSEAAAPPLALSDPPPVPTAFPLRATPRSVVQATAPARYRVQFSIGQETHDKLRRLQALLRREVPDGDPGTLFDRALTVLLAQVENRKLGVTARPRRRAPIRLRTDASVRSAMPTSRAIPRAVQRAAWERDGGQCAFVSRSGHRCTERTYLEFHHRVPHAHGGPATVENISIRCSRHNKSEAERDFGRGGGGQRLNDPPPIGA
jgi:5-methylcytosine-specific restriction endonuclease McrA